MSDIKIEVKSNIDVVGLKSYVENIREQKSESTSTSAVNIIMKKMLEEHSEGITEMNEEQKKQFEQNIYAKYEAGKKLSTREMSYLARHNPELYVHARRVQLMRNILEERLKHCRSKREADELFDKAHLLIGDNDPDKLVLHKAYDDVEKEFRKSGKYSSLPDKPEENETYTIALSYITWEQFIELSDVDYNYSENAELSPADSASSFEQTV